MSLLEQLTKEHRLVASRPLIKARGKNVHAATIDLLNTILMKDGCPNNVKTDTLRLLALMLEADPKDSYDEKSFIAYLKKVPKKSKVKVAKATGGWVTKDMLKL